MQGDYEFNYSVKDDFTYVDMGRQENRKNQVTRGSYDVLLPNGQRQIVDYYVDNTSGYVAYVRHDGPINYIQPSNQPTVTEADNTRPRVDYYKQQYARPAEEGKPQYVDKEAIYFDEEATEFYSFKAAEARSQFYDKYQSTPVDSYESIDDLSSVPYYDILFYSDTAKIVKID